MADLGSLTIMHLNINSVRNKLDLLNYYINILNPNIILLNETKINSNMGLLIPGFNIFRHDVTSAKGGPYGSKW